MWVRVGGEGGECECVSVVAVGMGCTYIVWCKHPENLPPDLLSVPYLCLSGRGARSCGCSSRPLGQEGRTSKVCTLILCVCLRLHDCLKVCLCVGT